MSPCASSSMEGDNPIWGPKHYLGRTVSRFEAPKSLIGHLQLDPTGASDSHQGITQCGLQKRNFVQLQFLVVRPPVSTRCTLLVKERLTWGPGGLDTMPRTSTRYSAVLGAF